MLVAVLLGLAEADAVDNGGVVLEWNFMSCSHVKSLVNLLPWLLIGCSLLCSQSGASLPVDPTFDNDYKS